MRLSHASNGLLRYSKVGRATLQFDAECVRVVYATEFLALADDGKRLSLYLADRAPLYYRTVSEVSESLRDGYFLTAFRETLARLPIAETFRESHMGEVAAAVYCEEVLGFTPIYSKLSHLTAENENAKKMDLVMADLRTDPVSIVLVEVKSSMKCEADGLPANHHKSCFADIFNSLNHYEEADMEFDLAAAKDRIAVLDDAVREQVKSALRPYAGTPIRYLGVAVVDLSTRNDKEAQVLGTRVNAKLDAADVMYVETLPVVTDETFARLDALRAQCS